jgi:hypothetical protein
MVVSMRAKLTIKNVERFEGAPDTERLTFGAVCKPSYQSDGADEDNTFAAFTPQADLTMSITNPNLVGEFSVGDTFYVDFTPV